MTAWQSAPAAKPGPNAITNDASAGVVPVLCFAMIASTRTSGGSSSGRPRWVDEDRDKAVARVGARFGHVRDAAGDDVLDHGLALVHRFAEADRPPHHQGLRQFGHDDREAATVQPRRDTAGQVAGSLDQHQRPFQFHRNPLG